eukprot:scaffold113393_cov18-Prasinocladus_malaysianus.AAC.1
MTYVACRVTSTIPVLSCRPKRTLSHCWSMISFKSQLGLAYFNSAHFQWDLSGIRMFIDVATVIATYVRLPGKALQEDARIEFHVNASSTCGQPY